MASAATGPQLVPRRMTARAIVVELTQPQPPKRTFAMAARKYVATTPT